MDPALSTALQWPPRRESTPGREDVPGLVEEMRAELAILTQELAAVEAGTARTRLDARQVGEIDRVIEAIRLDVASLTGELAAVEAAAATTHQPLAVAPLSSVPAPEPANPMPALEPMRVLEPPQKLSPIPLEAVLPMVALVLLLIVVLAWLG